MATTYKGLGRKVAKGAAWMVLVRVLRRGIGLIGTLVLARLLLPDDFGVVAVAQLVLMLLLATTELGFDAALIRQQTTERKYYDTVWTLQVLRGIAVAAILVALAYPMANFFGDPRVEAVLYVISIAALIEGVKNIGVVDFRKDLQFHKDFIFNLSARLISFVVTIVIAVIWRDYWALIFGILAARVTLVILSYVMHPYRPRFSLEVWGEILRFSKWILLNSLLRFIAQRSDGLIVGRLAGMQVLGLYSLARDISNLSTSALVAPIGRALFPGYAKIKDDHAELSKSFVEAFSLLLMLGAPIALGIWVTADPLVRLFLGPNWLEVIPLIKVLALFGLAFMVGANCGSVCLAVNKPHYNTIGLVARLLVVLPLLYFGVREFGAIGAAWAVTAAIPVERGIHIGLVLKLLKIQPATLFSVIWRIILSCAAMVFAVRAVMAALPETESIFSLIVVFAAAVATGIAVYVSVLLALWRMVGAPKGAEYNVLSLIRDKIKQYKRRITRNNIA